VMSHPAFLLENSPEFLAKSARNGRSCLDNRVPSVQFPRPDFRKTNTESNERT